MEYLSPEQVKGYTLQKPIGEGGFGEVYLATETRPNFEREVVLKRIRPKYANDPAFIQRFESEARMIARLEYPYIVPLYDYWRDPNGAYLVMRWLKGGSVKEMIASGPLDLATAGRIMNHICSALALAHRNAVIHRDIKPGNILLDEEGNAYLSDFGIAKDFLKFDSNTQPEDIVGSPKYISPEQARNEAVTPRTDVYSLGVTLYEMLAGEHPFPNANMYDLIYKHLNEPLPMLTDLDDAVQPDVNAVIQKATAKDPAKRYQDPLKFAQAFHDAAQLDDTAHAETLEQQLTIREQQVLSLIVQGKSAKEIASELYIALDTVKWHRRNIYKKLGVNRREQAIVVARNLTLIGDDGTYTGVDATSYLIDFEPENPYKGLESFTYADADRFYGRNDLIQKLMSRLEQDHLYSRFLAVLGPSGSGKSSLVKAGLVPARWASEAHDDEKWLVADMLPRQHPIDQLEIALRKVAARHTDGLSEILSHNERGLVKVAQLILPDNKDEILLIIDQFEEVFTLVESEEERAHFLNLITNAVTDPDSRLRVVITIRADYYDRPLYYPEFGDILRDRVETILPLSAEELQQAIVEPAKKVGVKFEDGLVASIVSDIHYQPGALPLLQYALTEMFDQRDGRTITREVYEKIGGAAGAIASTAEELFLSYDETGQETIRQMFLRLVTLGEGAEDTRRRTARDELLSIASDSYLMDEIIDTYAYARMLSLDNDPTTREPTVEVAHEAILREWERLRGWLNDSRDDIKTQRQLSDAAQRWQDGNRDTGHLLRGGPLTDFERWQETTQLALTSLEFEFLEASLADRERREAKEQAQAEREASLQLRARRILQGLVAVFFVAAVISIFFALRAAAAQDKAEREAEVSHSIALASSSQEALNDNDTDLAIALAIEANRIDDPPPQAQRALIEASYAPGTRMVLREHRDSVNAVAFSGDGTRAISGGGHAPRVEGSLIDNGFVEDTIRDFRVFIWDLQTGEILHELDGHTATVWAVEFSPDGKLAVSGDDAGDVIFWDVETGIEIYRYENRDVVGLNEIRSMQFSSDGAYLFIQVENRQIIMWDMATMSEVRRFEGTGFAFDAVNQQLVSHGAWGFNTVNWYDIHAQDPFPEPVIRTRKFMEEPSSIGVDSNHPRYVYIVMETYERRGNVFTNQTGGRLREINVWDTRDNIEVNRFPRYTLGIGALRVSHLDQIVYAVASDQILALDALTGEEVYAFRGHIGSITSIDLSADGTQLLTASEDGTIRVWDIRNGAELRRIYAGTGPTTRNAVSQDGTLLALSSENRIIEIWDLTTNQLVRRLEGHDSAVAMVNLVENDTALISVSADQTIRKWDVETGEELLRVNVDGYPPYAVPSPDGKYLFTYIYRDPAGEWNTQNSRVIVVYDIATLTPFRTYPARGGANFIPGTNHAISTSPDSIAFVWDLVTGEHIVDLEDSRGIGGTGARVLPDGKLAIGAIDDEALAMWDIETGKVVRRFVGNSDEITGLEVTPDGTIAVTYSTSGLVILWDVNTGQQIARFRGEFSGGSGSTPGFNGESVIFGNREGVIVEWDLRHDSDDVMAWVQENRYIRELSCFEKDFYDIAPCRELEAVPVIEGGRSTQTPIDLYIPSETPRPTATQIADKVIIQKGPVTFITPYNATVKNDEVHEWTLDIAAPETITLEMNGVQPVQTTLLSPSEEVVVSTTENMVGPIELDEVGIYKLQVEASPGVINSSTYFMTPRRE